MKKFLAVVAAAIVSFSFVACTSPFEDTGTSDGGSAAAKKVVIKVGVLNTTTEMDIFSKYKRGFETKYPNISLQLDPIPGDYSTGMNNYVNNDSFPDVVFTTGDQHGAYSSQGHFLDLCAYDEADDSFSFDLIYPELVETTHYSTSDEGVWFMPRDYNKVITFVNKTMLALVPGENGKMFAGYETFENLKANWNLDTFYEVCQAITDKVAENAANPGDVSQEEKLAGLIKNTYAVDARYNWAPSYSAILKHYGGAMIDTTKLNGADTDYAEVLSVDAKSTMEAYRSFYENLAKPGYVKPSLTQSGVSLFPNSQAAFWFTTRPSWGDVISNNATFDVDFLPFPYDYTGVGCSGYAITKLAASRYSENAETDADGQKLSNADYGWIFLKYIASEEGQNEFGSIGMGVPSLISLKDKGTWMEYGSAELNHEAFLEDVKGQTVLSVNDIYCFPATAQKTVSDNCISIMTYVVKENFWPADLTLEMTESNYSDIYAKVKEYKQVMMTRIEASL